MIAIDLFSGAGGMSLGAKMAGIDTQIVIESDPYAAATYTHNHKPAQGLINADIRNVKKSDIKLKKNPFIVFGGPRARVFQLQIKKHAHWTMKKIGYLKNSYE
jgi:DNA (cytosine-5)-methyltransferase 1